MLKGCRRLVAITTARIASARSHYSHHSSAQQLIRVEAPPPLGAVPPSGEKQKRWYCSGGGGGGGGQVGDGASEALGRAMDGGRSMAEKGKESGERLADKGREMMDKTKEASQHGMEKTKEAMMPGMSDDHHTDAGDESKTSGGVKGSMDSMGEYVKREMKTAKEMAAEMPHKVSETTAELGEVGVEAAKAIKRDASKLAEKMGLKEGEKESHGSH